MSCAAQFRRYRTTTGGQASSAPQGGTPREIKNAHEKEDKRVAVMTIKYKQAIFSSKQKYMLS